MAVTPPAHSGRAPGDADEKKNKQRSMPVAPRSISCDFDCSSGSVFDRNKKGAVKRVDDSQPLDSLYDARNRYDRHLLGPSAVQMDHLLAPIGRLCNRCANLLSSARHPPPEGRDLFIPEDLDVKGVSQVVCCYRTSAVMTAAVWGQPRYRRASYRLSRR